MEWKLSSPGFQLQTKYEASLKQSRNKILRFKEAGHLLSLTQQISA